MPTSWMMKEIGEQPKALARILKRGNSQFKKLTQQLPFQPRLIMLVARGSSDNAALFGRYLLEITTGIPVSLAAPAVHTIYQARLQLKDTLVVGVSQSGEGTDVNMVLEQCKRSGAFTIGITNEAKSSMAAIVDELFCTEVGREQSVAATKTYSAQLMSFYILARALANDSNKIDIEAIPDLAAQTLGLREQVAEIVERYRFMQHCVVVARGVNYANACEFAIKLMETSYVVAKPYSAADFQHGPLAVIAEGFPAFALVPPGRTLADMKKLLHRLQDLKSEIMAFSSEPAILKLAHKSIQLPHIDEMLSPIPYIIPAQLMAALLAEARGLNPDKPRSLTKVTKTI